MLSLNIPVQKLFGWFRRPWLWATGNWKLHHNNMAHSCITPHTEFSGETSNHPGDSALLQPRFGTLWLLAFSKNKITFEREEIFRPSFGFREIWLGSWWWLGELCEVPRCLLKGTVVSLSYVQYFLHLVSSSINVSIFHITWLDDPYFIKNLRVKYSEGKPHANL